MTRAEGGRVTQRCHNSRDEKRGEVASANDVTHRKCTEDLGDFEEGELKLDTERDGRPSGSQRRDEFVRYGRRTDVVGVQMKKTAQKDTNWYQ